MSSLFSRATLLQLSGILGAGIFVLPYVFSQSRLAPLGLVLVTFVIAQINLFYTDIILATKGDHQLAGYAGIYLGSFFRRLTLVNFLVLNPCILLAYLILATKFLQALFPGLSLLSAVLIFLLPVSLFHLSSIKIFKSYYLIIPLFLVYFTFVIFIVSLFFPGSSSNPAAPLFGNFIGPLVFALTGFTIIPEV